MLGTKRKITLDELLAAEVLESQLDQKQPMNLPPRDARISPTTSVKEAYYDASDFRSTSSGSGTSLPSFLQDQRDKMTYKELKADQVKHEKGRIRASGINKVKLRRSNSFQGNTRASPSRELMTAAELSKVLIEENPYLEKAEYRSKKDELKYATGKTKRKKRRKPKTKRKKLTKKRKHKKRKSTRKK
tara:strand:- start:337 stop:900 length:564 start_codon:yes stop_codon:yes gene_type:complete